MSDVDEKIQKVTSRLQTLGYDMLFDPKIDYEGGFGSELLVYPLSKLEKEVDCVIEKAAPKVTKKSRKMDDGKILDYLIVSHEAIPLVDNKTDEYIDPSKTDKFLRQAEDIRKKKVQMAKREFLAAFQKLENEFLGKITSDVVSSVHKLIYK